MNLPEWLVVGILGLFVAVSGWGIKRLIETNDDTNRALKAMNDHLGKINGRLGKTEQWQQMHERMDDERHQEAQKSSEAMWQAIGRIRS